MALKVLLLRKQLTDKQAEQARLRKTQEGYKTREGEIAKAIEEATTEEDKAAVTAAVEELESSMAETQTALETIAGEIAKLQEDIAAAEASAAEAAGGGSDSPPTTTTSTENSERSAWRMNETRINTRSRCFSSRAALKEFFERSDSKEFLARVRELGSLPAAQQRAVTGAGLGIPVTWLELLRDNLENYSKLMQYCTVRQLSGEGRQTIAGDIPEGVWMETVSNLNELELSFTQVEVDGYMVGGYIPIHESYLKDSDIRLGEEILYKLGQAIGYALDKSIVYGTGTKMPIGYVTRLAATAKPSWWGTNEGTFTDLHTSNILKLNIDGLTGADFFAAIGVALAKAKPNYSNGQAVWVMNHFTHIALITKALAFDAGGALVSMLKDEMPVVGGKIVELEFMDDYTIAGGYMSLQLMVEREGAYLGSSEHVRYLQNQVVYKGYGRYDGRPLKGEAFVMLRWNNTDAVTTKTFAADYANTDLNALIVTSVAGTAAGDTKVTVAGVVSATNVLKYIVGGQQTIVTKGQMLTSAWTAFESGADLKVATGKTITVVELDSSGKVISVGNVIATAKA